MPLADDTLKMLHLFLQVGFVVVTSALLLIMIINRIRVGRVLTSWRMGRFWGIPLEPTLFLGVLFVLMGLSKAMAAPISYEVFIGYVVGGGFWLYARLLARTLFVTEQGLIPGFFQKQPTIAWDQIIDYMASDGSKPRYSFFYLDEANQRRRFDLVIPWRHQTSFRRIIRERLDVRFEHRPIRSEASKKL